MAPEPGGIMLWTFCSFFKTKEMVTWSFRAGVLGLGVILPFALGTSLTSLSFSFPFGEMGIMHIKKGVLACNKC